MALNKKATFSYLDQNVNWVRLDGNFIVKVERLNNHVARVYLVDNANAQQQVPANMAMTDSEGNRFPPYKDNFMITWADSYTLTFNGQVVLRLNNQKEQAFLALPNAEHGIE
ncbi:hypothetical protein HYH03_017660 [Edaphochlamys debaryana]|uniref:Uncharacterized protein n=1 Tax=Edaphochlamys debaryana TaxID=47281 RepID=A0A836BQD0_9CHLO|nr:hypothetical protein HYH03_017660 [Edaphochlamys debaryana]|eukprot:KAG2483478.1 hypothetical protein HYH03_017660 [Edaphochlamys debaryana]